MNSFDDLNKIHNPDSRKAFFFCFFEGVLFFYDCLAQRYRDTIFTFSLINLFFYMLLPSRILIILIFFEILRLKYINAGNFDLSVKVGDSSSLQSTTQNACIQSNAQGLQGCRLVCETFTLTWPVRFKATPHNG